MKNFILTLLLSFCHFSALAESPTDLFVGTEIYSNSSLKFISHNGPGKFDNALAFNVSYDPVRLLRKPIEEVIGRKLKFLTTWDSKGEAHVTVITPPEYSEALSKVLSMEEIDEIARKERIQFSDLKVLGLGSGKLVKDGQLEETFFLFVDSANLRKIRHEIYALFLKKGGVANAWDPLWWFPHITIGYTKRDLHETDGVTKNIRSSWDTRFNLIVR